MYDDFDDDFRFTILDHLRAFRDDPLWYLKWLIIRLVVKGIIFACYASMLAIPGEYVVEWLGWYEMARWAHFIAAPAKAFYWVVLWVLIAFFAIMALVALLAGLLIGYIRLRDPGALRVRHDFPPGPMHPEQLKEIEQ